MADFPTYLPKYNFHSLAVKERCTKELLLHQREALVKLESYFQTAEQVKQHLVAIVSMPTGSGKTGVMSCLPYFLGSIGLQGPTDKPTGEPVYQFDKPVLVIAPDLEIAKQLEQQMLVTARDDSTEAPQTFLVKRNIVPAERIGNVHPTGVKMEETSSLANKYFLAGKEIIITNAQKFTSQGGWKTQLPGDMYRLILVDEAHHHPAKTWRDIVKKFSCHALVVFFTATPFRGDKKPILDPALYPSPLTYHLSLQSAVEAGIIRKPEFVELPEASDDPNEMILRKVKELQIEKDDKMPLPDGVSHMAMAIAKNTDDAENLVDLWKRLYPDAPASCYHSKMPKHEREEAMGKLRGNQLKLVVVVAMLLEGFDHPPISIAAVTHNIRSPVKFVQFVGRAQRIYRSPEGRNERNGIAHIVSHIDYEQSGNFMKFCTEELIPDA